ncbi:MAG: ATP-binding protein [Endomicrobium sp.]|jgi:DNA helicase HerA-like ATPase|nr:ATP-binding protein [Endomicrobium sp.]
MNNKKSGLIKEAVLEDSILVVGIVFKVDGKDITVKVNKDKNLQYLFFKGEALKNVSVGLSNYIKITKGFTEIICKITGERIEENKSIDNKDYYNEETKINRFIKVSVFGFYDDEGRFQHGIKELPLIGDECRLLTKEEFGKLHNLYNDKELCVSLGSLSDDFGQKIKVSVKELFSGHIAVFGNTGSGKSNTLAKIYSELFKNTDLSGNFKNSSKFIFIDFNGEYSKTGDNNDEDEILASASDKTVYKLSTRRNTGTEAKNDKYPISEITKNKDEELELISILLDATEKTQRPFLYRAVTNEYFDENDGSNKEIDDINKKLEGILDKKDKNFNKFFLKKFIDDFEGIGFKIIRDKEKWEKVEYNAATTSTSFYIKENNVKDNKYWSDYKDEFLGHDGCFEPSVKDPTKDLDVLQKIQFKILSRYYYEILNGYSKEEHLGPLIGRLKKRFDMLSKMFEFKETKTVGTNIEIIDLKNVNLEMKKIVPLLICKIKYNEQKDKRDRESENSLHIIIDEAHNILSEDSNRESESWKDYRLETFEEIIKEGRKFGVFLTIASQRPSDISPTIISQIHNYFIHRLVNENDLKAINRAVSYLDKLSFDSIPNLSVGCCFIAGQMTQFPLSIRIEQLEKAARPQSETIDINKLWNKNRE